MNTPEENTRIAGYFILAGLVGIVAIAYNVAGGTWALISATVICLGLGIMGKK